MPAVVRGSRRSNSFPHPQSQPDLPSNPTPASPTSPVQDRRVTFEQSRLEPSNSLPTVPTFSPRQSTSNRRHSSHHQRYRDLDRDENDPYYDSRAASQREYRRRGTTLQSYYLDHPELLPQLPFTFRHGFKRWKLAGYIGLMVFDACIVPILLYYAMTFGGNVQGYIVFAVVTAIWGGPTYVEFAIRSLRLIKKEHFFKPLGADRRWVFDITNWIFVLTIGSVTTLLIVGAAPHVEFLRVLSMPGPAILYCLAGPVFLMTLYSACEWKAPFRISSTAQGEKVLPGIYYVAEDIVAVNAGGGRPFREGWAARYNASPIFRKMIRDQSWFWSISGLLVAISCTIIVCIHAVPNTVAYGIGWGVPFLWAGIWAAITLPWVRSIMAKEKKSWEEDSALADIKEASPAVAQPLAGKASESSTLHSSEPGRYDEDAAAQTNHVVPDSGESRSQRSEGTTLRTAV
ncbi:hypothetical protein B7494_g5180 [Chlorociboria aeruginascens]|nr:hypothetical protein B7494_g5180 [Chlorociboria aeruginascens]